MNPQIRELALQIQPETWSYAQWSRLHISRLYHNMENSGLSQDWIDLMNLMLELSPAEQNEAKEYLHTVWGGYLFPYDQRHKTSGLGNASALWTRLGKKDKKALQYLSLRKCRTALDASDYPLLKGIKEGVVDKNLPICPYQGSLDFVIEGSWAFERVRLQYPHAKTIVCDLPPLFDPVSFWERQKEILEEGVNFMLYTCQKSEMCWFWLSQSLEGPRQIKFTGRVTKRTREASDLHLIHLTINALREVRRGNMVDFKEKPPRSPLSFTRGPLKIS